MKPLPLQWRVPLLAGTVVATAFLVGLGLVVRETSLAGERQLREPRRPGEGASFYFTLPAGSGP
ncbi:MAG TPA: hypothetical protein VMB75_10435 [Rhodocyclaceae bacterium]|nr:hypothetical protein [Rhodocyclaceae bacterium]